MRDKTSRILHTVNLVTSEWNSITTTNCTSWRFSLKSSINHRTPTSIINSQVDTLYLESTESSTKIGFGSVIPQVFRSTMATPIKSQWGRCASPWSFPLLAVAALATIVDAQNADESDSICSNKPADMMTKDFLETCDITRTICSEKSTGVTTMAWILASVSSLISFLAMIFVVAFRGNKIVTVGQPL